MLAILDDVEISSLVKVVLLLVIALLVLQLVGAVFRLAFGVLTPLLFLAVAVLAALWLLDRF